MPQIREGTIGPQVVEDSINLPRDMPAIPDAIRKRFPEAAAVWQDEIDRFWRRVKTTLNEANQSVSQNITQNLNSVRSVRVSVEGLTAEVETLEEAVIVGDTAVARRIVTVSAMAGLSSDLTISSSAPGSPALNDYWIDTSVALTPITYRWSGAAWVEVTEPISIAALQTESVARASADSALSTRTDLLEAQVQTPTTGLLARVTTIESAYVDASGAYAQAISAISAELTGPGGSIYSAVDVVASALATTEGYLESRYTINVTAGPVVTGMTLFSASGPDTDVSYIRFQADRFQVDNTGTGLTPFEIDGGKINLTGDVKIDGTLVVAGTLTLSQVSDAGALASENAADWATQVTGAGKPSDNADVTLAAVNGGLSVTGGGITLTSGSPSIKAGQTAYDTGTGFWLGLDTGTPKFSIGNSSGNKLTWDNSSFNLIADQVIIGTAVDDTVGDLQVDGEISCRNFGAGAQNAGFTATVAGGSISSPTATQSGSFAALRLRGYDGTTFGVGASLRLKAQANFSGGGSPTEMELIVSDGSANQYLYLSKDGALEFGSARDTNLYRAAANLLKTDDVFEASGYLGKAGVGGATGNQFNFYWTGTKVQVWVDTTMVWEQP